jgi:hypothetical protein
LPSLLDDVSDVDSPSEMLAADRTLTDAEPIAAGEPSSVELSATDLLDDDDDLADATGAADATGEIEAADILEVASALRTSRLPVLSAASAPLTTTRMPSFAAMPSGHHPSSIAPLAFDVTPTRPSFQSLPSWVPTPTSTQQIARMAGIPERSPRFVMAAASVLGMCVFAAVAGAVLGYSRPNHDATAAGNPAAVHGAPRVAVVSGAHEEITPPPRTSTPAAPTAASSSSTGTIRTSPSISGVLVDGAPHKVNGGAVTVACGRHMVKAPGHPARLVIVPCGGHASL